MAQPQVAARPYTAQGHDAVRAAFEERAFLRLARLLEPALQLVFRCFPKQANGFAFIVLKPHVPDGLQPWLEFRDGQVRLKPDWLAGRYDPRKIGSPPI